MNLAGPWPIRVGWLLLPLALGPALDAALAERSRAVGLVVAALAWAAWTAGVVAVLVPRTLGLTLLRTAAPAALVLGVWASLQESTGTGAALLAAVTTTAVAVVALAPSTGDVFVNGSAYGPERRFALRVPAPLLFGPVVIVWAMVVTGVALGPLLLASGRWVAGGVATLVGFGVAAVGSRSLHQLARRWFVMVPAGVVIHDPTALTSHLFKRSAIASMGPAPADSGALDLTANAPGLALEIQLQETETLELLRRGAGPTMVHARAVMFTPTRPGAVLREAADRRVPVAADRPAR